MAFPLGACLYAQACSWTVLIRASCVWEFQGNRTLLGILGLHAYRGNGLGGEGEENLITYTELSLFSA